MHDSENQPLKNTVVSGPHCINEQLDRNNKISDNYYMKTKNILQNLTDNLWAEYSETFPMLVKFNPPIVNINNRLSKCAGRNFTELNTIELSGKFLAQFEHNMLNVILPHEIAHQIDWNLNGWYNRKPHHGKDWITIMIQLNQKPDPYHTMELKG